MSYEFRFEHNGKRYSVVGKYDTRGSEQFSIAIRLNRSELPSALGAQGGAKLERTIAAVSEAELISKLETSYPGLTNFSLAND